MNDIIIKLNGVDCTEGLITYRVDSYNLHNDQSGRTLDGVMHVKVIRPCATIELGWKLITTAEKQYILQQVSDCNTFDVDYIWENDEELRHIKAYTGDIKTEMVVNNNNERLWNLDFTVIEV